MRTTLELLTDGWRALLKELGPADALRYKTLFQPGRGDYVSEREELFGHMTVDDWAQELEKRGPRKRGAQDGPDSKSV